MKRNRMNANYVVTAMAEIPRHEYKVALGWIDTWMDLIKIMDVVKEARRRSEEELAKIELPPGVAGAAACARTDHQQGQCDHGGDGEGNGASSVAFGDTFPSRGRQGEKA